MTPKNPDRKENDPLYEQVSALLTKKISQILDAVYKDGNLENKELEVLFVKAKALNLLVSKPYLIEKLLVSINYPNELLPKLQNLALSLINNPNQIKNCSENAKRKKLTKNILIYAINSVFREHQILMPPEYTIHIDRPYYKIEIFYTGENMLLFVNEILKKFHFIDFSLSAFSFTLNKQKYSYILTLEDRRGKNDIIHTYGRNS